jgi:hypothetical protein
MSISLSYTLIKQNSFTKAILVGLVSYILSEHTIADLVSAFRSSHILYSSVSDQHNSRSAALPTLPQEPMTDETYTSHQLDTATNVAVELVIQSRRISFSPSWRTIKSPLERLRRRTECERSQQTSDQINDEMTKFS